MTEHNHFYDPYASFMNAQLALLKVAAVYIDTLVVLDPASAGWATLGANRHARETIKLRQSASFALMVTPADVLAKFAGPMSDAMTMASWPACDEAVPVCEHSRSMPKRKVRSRLVLEGGAHEEISRQGKRAFKSNRFLVWGRSQIVICGKDYPDQQYDKGCAAR